MAEVPEEVVINVEAEDRASPTLKSLGRNLLVLGSNVAYLTRDLGVQNAAFESSVRMMLTVGHAIRAANAAKQVLIVTTQLLVAAETKHAAATAAASATQTAYSGTAASATAANLGLAASFRVLWAAMGPIGWLMLGLGALAGGIAGYGLAGGFGGGQAAGMSVVGQGPYQEPLTQINIENANFKTKQEAEETVKEIGNLFHKEFRRHRH